MLRVQFNGTKSFYNVDFSSSGEKVILKGKKFPKKLEQGFKAYRLNGEMLGDYSSYTEVMPIQDGFVFSQKGECEHEKN